MCGRKTWVSSRVSKSTGEAEDREVKTVFKKEAINMGTKGRKNVKKVKQQKEKKEKKK